MNQYMREKNGFTFVEVVIAVTVIGLLLTTLIQTQTGLIMITGSSRERISRAVALWNTFMYAQRQPWYQKGEGSENIPADEFMQYRYEQQSVNEQSVLAPYAKTGVMEHIVGYDEDGVETRLVMYRYQPPQQEKETE